MNKKKTIGIVVVIIFAVVSLSWLIAMTIALSRTHAIPLSETCNNDCVNFNLSYAKVDQVYSYGGGNYFCYCTKDGIPINIGTVKIKYRKDS